MVQEEFEEKVKEYIRACNVRRSAKEDYDEIVAEKPVRPSQLNSIVALRDFQVHLMAYENNMAAAERARKEAAQEVTRLQSELIVAIQVGNVWIKAGKWAVGCYTDAWGGNHAELDICEWAENLPPLKDKLDYP